MRPVQILANNLLYDIGQTAIPTDNVDPERLQAPRAWDIKELTRFILFHRPLLVGLRLLDVPDHALRCSVASTISTPQAASRSASLFQTGWFVESLLRRRSSFTTIPDERCPLPLQSRASWFMTAMSALGVNPVLTLGHLPRFTGCPLSTGRSSHSRCLLLLLTQGVKMFISWRKWV